MLDNLHKRVLQAIQRDGMFRPGDRVGVGVSGGADSVALLRLLDDLRPELGIFLSVLHFNHQLRGAESDDDEQFVAALAEKLGTEFIAGREDVAAAARENKWNLEDAARRLRYGFFRAALQDGESAEEPAGLARVAVAHSADDQAETVLARLVRGTGPAGLGAIYPVKGFLVRPLLEIRRGELRAYLERIGQSWREDPSNRDVRRLRARLRHQILPALEGDLQPALVPHLCRLAEQAREDEAFWKVFMRQRLNALLRREEGRLGIRCADLLSPLFAAETNPTYESVNDAQGAVAGRLVRGIVEELRGDGGMLTAQHVKQVLRLASTNSSGHRTELPGAVAERSFEWMWFSAKDGTHSKGQSSNKLASNKWASNKWEDEKGVFLRAVSLEPAGQETIIAVPEIRRRFSLKAFDWTSQRRETRLFHVLDRDLLCSPLVLRNWQPGDSFQPQGRRHVHKLKQLLREKRVGMRDRWGWPVLTSGGQVVWARGCPVAVPFAAGLETREGVVIAEEEI